MSKTSEIASDVYSLEICVSLVRIDSGVVVVPWREKGRDVWYPGVLRYESASPQTAPPPWLAYIITGIHIYAWSTQDHRSGGGKR